MPNHVVNEVIFSCITQSLRNDLLSACCNEHQQVDFERLVPAPINSWRGGVSASHEKAFPHNDLDWCRANWGTKWNAYGHRQPELTDNGLILRFDSAWRPPYGWLVAVFNCFHLDFDHNWLSEGSSQGVCGTFRWIDSKLESCNWKEAPAEGEMQRHLHTLRWGVPEFADEDAA